MTQKITDLTYLAAEASHHPVSKLSVFIVIITAVATLSSPSPAFVQVSNRPCLVGGILGSDGVPCYLI